MISQYLINKDNELKTKKYADSSIEDVIFVYRNSDDEFENLIFKYFYSSNKEFCIDENEYSIVLENLNSDHHIIIDTLLQYLIASSRHKESSTLIECCKIYIDLYFREVKGMNCGAATNTLLTFLQWTIKKFTNSRERLSEKLHNKLLNCDVDGIRFLSITDNLLRDPKMSHFFGFNQYKVIYDKYLVDKAEQMNVHFYLGIYEEYYKYIVKCDKNAKKAYEEKYRNFVLSNIRLIDSHTKQILLQKIRILMDELKCYDDEDYALLDEELERANNEVLNELIKTKIPFPQEAVEQIKNCIENQTKEYKNKTDSEKIDKLMFDLPPISVAEIQKNIKKEKEQTLSSLFDELLLDADGRVINFDTLSEEESFSLKSGNFIEMTVQLMLDTNINIFFRTFQMNDNARNRIKELISNSKLVSDKRVESISNFFIEFFQQDFSHSVYDIVEELEESLRYYFKEFKLNIKKRNGSGDLIGLNDVFNNHKKNNYRSKLLETIDEDFYFTLKWFLTDDYGYGLRNKIAHRIKAENLYKEIYAIYSVLQIFRLYWGLQKD